MSRSNTLKPFLSVVLITLTLFTLAFFKMEIRRVGYSVLKLSREEKRLRDRHRQQVVQLAHVTRPERLRSLAQSRLTLRKAESGQIIQMTEMGIALKQ